MEETGAAKVSETEAVVWWQRKQRECLCGEYIGGGQWKQRGSGDSSNNSDLVVAVLAEGTGAVVSAAATVQWHWQTTAAMMGQAMAAETEAEVGQQQLIITRQRQRQNQQSWRGRWMWWQQRWRRLTALAAA